MKIQNRLLCGAAIFIYCQQLLAGVAPAPVSGISIDRSASATGTDLQLIWPAVTTDIYGDPASVDHYNIYRGTTPGFVPDYANGSNRIGQATTADFVDGGVLGADASSYYYYVTAVTADGAESLLPSPLAEKRYYSFTHLQATQATTRYWIPLPAQISYASADALLAEGGGVAQLVRWDPQTQTEVIWNPELAAVAPAGSYTDFSFQPGEAVAVDVAGDASMTVLGVHNTSNITLNYNPNNFNRQWLSLPQPSAYANASQALDDLNRGATEPVATKLAKFDTVSDTYPAWFQLGDRWLGQDFPITPDVGVMVSVTGSRSWAPTTAQPSALALAQPAQGYEGVTVTLNAEVVDNGAIASYQWDFEGDGVFDSSEASPSFTYRLTDQTATQFRPTLVVTDSEGHRALAWTTVTLDSLNVNLTVSGFNPSGGEFGVLTYTLPQEGNVTLKLYNGAGELVRTMLADAAQLAGAQSVTWDGKDDAGLVVADGSYYVTIDYQVDGYTSTYDTRTQSGGKDITAELTDINIGNTLSPLEGQYVDINYSLPSNALVTVLVKDAAGNTLRTLLDSVTRAVGSHTEIWDGALDDGQLIAPGTGFTVEISATDLSVNSLVTTGNQPELSNVSAAPLRFSPATNPYGSQTDRKVRVEFSLNKAADVTLRVYSGNGTLISTLSKPGAATNDFIEWGGRNDAGVLMADGVYMLQLSAVDSSGLSSDAFTLQTEIFY